MHEKGTNMAEFKLKNHRVEEASFNEDIKRVKKNGIEINIEGSAFVPTDLQNDKNVCVSLTFRMGKAEDGLFFMLKTVTVFEILGECKQSITEAEVNEKCFPVSLTELRKTATNVLLAYGKTNVNLPPFTEA